MFRSSPIKKTYRRINLAADLPDITKLRCRGGTPDNVNVEQFSVTVATE